MPRMTHPAQVDLRVRDAARKFLNFRTGAGSGYKLCQDFHCFRPVGIQVNWQA